MRRSFTAEMGFDVRRELATRRIRLPTDKRTQNGAPPPDRSEVREQGRCRHGYGRIDQERCEIGRAVYRRMREHPRRWPPSSSAAVRSAEFAERRARNTPVHRGAHR